MTPFPPPRFSQGVLAALLAAQTERGEPVSDLWFRLTRRLDPPSAEVLPQALGLAAPMVAGDRDRLRLLASLAVAYDLFELTAPLLRLAQTLADPEIVLDVAALATHPGLPGEVRDRVDTLREGLPGHLRAPFDVRLDPDAASSDQARALAIQRWPGIVTPPAAEAGAPLVAVADEGFPRDVVYHLLHELRRHGALVRRIPASFAQDPDPRWLGRWCPVIATSGAILATLRRRGLPVDASQLVVPDEQVVGARRGRDLLAAVDDVLGRFGAPRIHVPDKRTEITLQSTPLDIGVFQLGAYVTREVALLSGYGESTVQDWRKRPQVLHPVAVDGFHYWHFSQLVALRTYNYVREHHRKRLSLDVVEELADFAGRDRPVELGVTRNAIVVFEEDGPYELRSGQRVLEEPLTLDATFQAFTVGGGTAVPGLLEPSPHTKTHPAVLGGTPRIDGTRVPCRSVAEASRRRTPERVRKLYPDISPVALSEAREIGAKIIGDKALR